MKSTPLNAGVVPFGEFLDNDSSHNFLTLGLEFLDAAKFTNAGFKNMPRWPTYFLVFQSLENFLKAYLLARGASMDHIKDKIGHRLCDALAEAKAKGLSVPVTNEIENIVMAMSRDYTARDFQYCSIGEWTVVPPNVVIDFVEKVSKVM